MSTIDRDILIKKYINPDIEKFHNSDVRIVLENLKQNILKMSSADRPQGEWIEKESVMDLGDGTFYECSNCGKQVLLSEREPHGIDFEACPYCLAKMKRFRF